MRGMVEAKQPTTSLFFINKYLWNTVEKIFVTTPELERKFRKRFDEIPTGAIYLYTYYLRRVSDS